MAAKNMSSFLIYIDETPFCILYGDEQDAKDLTEKREGYTYENLPTVIVQHGIERGA